MSKITYKLTQDDRVNTEQKCEEVLIFGPDFSQPSGEDIFFTLTSKKSNPLYAYNVDGQNWQQVGNNTYVEEAELEVIHMLSFTITDSFNKRGVNKAWVYTVGPHSTVQDGLLKYSDEYGSTTFIFDPPLSTTGEDLMKGGVEFDVLTGKRGYGSIKRTIKLLPGSLTATTIEITPEINVPNLITMVWTDRSDYMYAINQIQYKIDKTAIEQNIFDHAVIQTDPLGLYTGSDLSQRSIIYPTEGFPNNFTYHFLPHRFDSTGSFTNNDFLYWESRRSTNSTNSDMEFDANRKYAAGSIVYYKHQYYETIENAEPYGPKNTEYWREIIVRPYEETYYETDDVVSYVVNEEVKYFKALSYGTLRNPLEDPTWSPILVNAFDPSSDYLRGIYVIQDENLYLALKNVKNDAPDISVKWRVSNSVYNFENTYLKGSVCVFQKVWYEATFDIYSRAPGKSTNPEETFWDMQSVYEYNENTNYRQDDFVRFGSGIYRARTDVDAPANCLDYLKFFPVYLKRGEQFSSQLSYEVGSVAVVDGIYYIAKENLAPGIFNSNQWIKIITEDWDNDFNHLKTYQIGDEITFCASDLHNSAKYRAIKVTKDESPLEHPESWQEIESYDGVIRNTYLFNPRSTYNIGELIMYDYKYDVSGFGRSEMRPFLSIVKIVNSTPYYNDVFWKTVDNFNQFVEYDVSGTNVMAKNQSDVDSGLCFTALMPSPSSFIDNDHYPSYSQKYWQRIDDDYEESQDIEDPGKIIKAMYRSNDSQPYVDYGALKLLPVAVSGSYGFERAWSSIDFEELDENKIYDLGDEVIYNGKLYECIQYASKGSQLCFNEDEEMIVAEDGYFHFEESRKLKTSDWRVGDYRKNPSDQSKFQIFVDCPIVSGIAPDEKVGNYLNGSWAEISFEEYDNSRTYSKGDKVAYNGNFYKVINDGIKGILPNSSNTHYWSIWHNYYAYYYAYQYRPVKGNIYQDDSNVYTFSTCTCPNFIQGISTSDDRYWKLINVSEYDRSTTYSPSDKVRYKNGLYASQNTFTGISPKSKVHWTRLDSNYDSNSRYYNGDIVLCNDSFYEVNTDFVTPLNRRTAEHNYWRPFVSADYVEGNTYTIGDVVRFNNALWRFKGKSATFDVQDLNWKLVTAYNGSMQRYKGDFVSYQNLIYRIYDDTRGYNPESYMGKFARHFYQTAEDVTDGKSYAVGSLVNFDGRVYCLWPSTTTMNIDEWEATGSPFDASRSLYEIGEVVEYGGQLFAQTEQEKIYKNVAPDENYYWEEFVIEDYDENKIYYNGDMAKYENARPMYVTSTSIRGIVPDNAFYWEEIYTDRNRTYSPSAEYALEEAVTYNGKFYWVARIPALISHHWSPGSDYSSKFGRNFSYGDGCWQNADKVSDEKNYDAGDGAHDNITSAYVALVPVSAYWGESLTDWNNTITNSFWKRILETRYNRCHTYDTDDEVVENYRRTDGYYYIAKTAIDNRFLNASAYWEPQESMSHYERDQSYGINSVVYNWDGSTTYYRSISALDNIFVGASAYWEELSVRGLFDIVNASRYQQGDIVWIWSNTYGDHFALYQANVDIDKHVPIDNSLYWDRFDTYNFEKSYQQYRDENNSLPTQLKYGGYIGQYEYYHIEPVEDIHSVDIDSTEENVVVEELSAATEFTYWHKQHRSRYRVYNEYDTGKLVAKRRTDVESNGSIERDYYYEALSPIVNQCPPNTDLWDKFVPYIPFKAYQKGERVAWYNDSNRYFTAKEAIPNTSPTNLYTSENPDGYWREIEIYDSTKQYSIDDYVTYEGTVYQAITQSTGQSPSNNENYWKRIDSGEYSTVDHQAHNVGEIVYININYYNLMKLNGYTDEQIDEMMYYRQGYQQHHRNFIAVRNIDNVTPKISNATNSAYWNEHNNFIDWSPSLDYASGDIVRLNYYPGGDDFSGSDLPYDYWGGYGYCFFYQAKQNIISNYIDHNDAVSENHQAFWHYINKSIVSYGNYNYYHPNYGSPYYLKYLEDYASGSVVADFSNTYDTDNQICYVAIKDVVANYPFYNDTDYSGSHKIFWRKIFHSEYFDNKKDYEINDIVYYDGNLWKAKQNIISNDLMYNNYWYTAEHYPDYDPNHPIFWSFVGYYDSYGDRIKNADDVWVEGHQRDFVSGQIVSYNSGKFYRAKQNIISNNILYDDHYQGNHVISWNRTTIQNYDSAIDWQQGDLVKMPNSWYGDYSVEREDPVIDDWIENHRDSLFIAKVDVESNHVSNERYWKKQRLAGFSTNSDGWYMNIDSYAPMPFDVVQGRKIIRYTYGRSEYQQTAEAKRDMISNSIRYNTALNREPQIALGKIYIDTAQYSQAQAIKFSVGGVLFITGIFDYFTEITLQSVVRGENVNDGIEVFITLKFAYPHWGCPVGTAKSFDNEDNINGIYSTDHTSLALSVQSSIVGDVAEAANYSDETLTVKFVVSAQSPILQGTSWFDGEIEVLQGKGRISHASNQMDIGHQIFWEAKTPNGTFSVDNDYNKGDIVYRYGQSFGQGILVCKKSYISNSPAHYLGSPSNLAGHKAFWEKLPEFDYDYYHGTQNIGNGDVGFKRNDVAKKNGNRYLSLTINPMHSLSVEKYWKWNPMMGAKEVYLTAANEIISKFPRGIPSMMALIVNIQGGWLSVFDVFHSNDGFDGSRIWALKDVNSNLRYYIESFRQIVMSFTIDGNLYHADTTSFETNGFGYLINTIFESDPQIIPLISDDGSEISTVKMDYDGNYSTIPLVVTCGNDTFFMFCNIELSGNSRIWLSSKIENEVEISAKLKHENGKWKLDVVRGTTQTVYTKAGGTNPWSMIGASDEFTVVQKPPLASTVTIPGTVHVGNKNGDALQLMQITSWTSNNSENINNLVDLMRGIAAEHSDVGYVYPVTGNNERWIKCAEAIIDKYAETH